MGDLITIGIGRLVQMFLALLQVRLYTAILSHEEIGRLALISGVATTLSLLIDRSVSAYWYRMVLPWARERHGRSGLLMLFAASGTLTVFLLVAALLVREVVGLGTPISLGWMLVVGGIAVYLNSAFNALTTSLNLLGERGAFVALSIAGLALGLILAFTLTKLHPAAEWWLLGIAFGQLLTLPVLLRLVYRGLVAGTHAVSDGARVPASIPPRRIGAWFHFAFPAFMAALLYAAQLLGYRFALNAVAGARSVAVFTVGFGAGVAVINAFDYFATQFLLPHFFAGIADASPERIVVAWNRYANALIPATLLVAAFAAAGGPFLIRILADSSFAGSGSIVAWGVAVDALRLITQLVAMVSRTPGDATVAGSVVGRGFGIADRDHDTGARQADCGDWYGAVVRGVGVVGVPVRVGSAQPANSHSMAAHRRRGRSRCAGGRSVEHCAIDLRHRECMDCVARPRRGGRLYARGAIRARCPRLGHRFDA